jgi:hypothetical protein
MSRRIIAPPPVQQNGHGTPEILKNDAPPNPFDLEALRLSQDFGEAVGVKKVLTKVRVTKPHKSWFVRVRSGKDHRCNAVVLEVDDEIYWVAPPLWSALADEPTVTRRRLLTAVTTQQNVFIWPIGLPDAEGKLNSWHESAMAVAVHAEKTWCRAISNRQVGAYEVREAPGLLKEPAWPEMPFQQLLELAFKDRCITEWDHPALRSLRGES